MIGPHFMDEIDCGSFFDHIDDLLEFPGDDVDADLPRPCNKDDAFLSIWPTHCDSMPCSDSVFSGNCNSDLSAELSVPYEEIVQLEWLSTFVEDSFSDKSITIDTDELTTWKDSTFRTSSPVSVLESSSSTTADKTIPRGPPVQCGRARTKRPRPATFNPPRPPLQLISPTSSVTETTTSEQIYETFAESFSFVVNRPNQEEKTKKKIKLSGAISQVLSSQPVRKCMHCEITKTPQWRAGPMGPKTLCNACGVRYKSGRLFPEYRPAASPTFVSSVHSNSHKKVLEMRNKGVDTFTVDFPSSLELIPNTNSGILLD